MSHNRLTTKLLPTLRRITTLLFAWCIWTPLGISADTSRQSLTGLVYILLLPALHVLWKSPLGLDSLRISACSPCHAGLEPSVRQQ